MKSRKLALLTLAIITVCAAACDAPDESPPDEYEQASRRELDDSQPQLPSDCERMIKMWQEVLDSRPGASVADAARQRKARWEAKLKEEIERGFQIKILGVEVQPVKGPSHRLMAGRPWDPALAGQKMMLPDAYAVLEIDGDPVIYTQPARDTFNAEWPGPPQPVQANDNQAVEIRVRDRDVAEKAALLALGLDVFGFSGIGAVSETMKRDDDDDICRWSGTIRSLMEKGGGGLPAIGDCRRLRVRVTRRR